MVESQNNDTPLMYRQTEAAALIASVVERGDGYIRFANNLSSGRGACYLGAILSADRQTVYWVNNTRPLP